MKLKTGKVITQKYPMVVGEWRKGRDTEFPVGRGCSHMA